MSLLPCIKGCNSNVEVQRSHFKSYYNWHIYIALYTSCTWIALNNYNSNGQQFNRLDFAVTLSILVHVSG